MKEIGNYFYENNFIGKGTFSKVYIVNKKKKIKLYIINAFDNCIKVSIPEKRLIVLSIVLPSPLKGASISKTSSLNSTEIEGSPSSNAST